MCSFPFAPIQILTGDTRKVCSFLRGRLHDERRSFRIKLRIERRFESLPGVQRFADLWGTPRSFRTSEKNKIVPFREVRGFANLESAHPNNNFPLIKLNPLPLCGLSSALGDLFLLLPQQIFALRAIIGGLAAFVTFLWKVCPCRDGTLRVLLSAFLSKEKQTGGKAATHQTATSGSQGSARLTAFA